MVTFEIVQCHLGVTYIFNFWHSGIRHSGAQGWSARVPECQK